MNTGDARLEVLNRIAERDGLTVDAARVLIEMWAWPLWLAIQPAYEKARDNHPDWQSWRDEKRDAVPSLTEWDAMKYRAGA